MIFYLSHIRIKKDVVIFINILWYTVLDTCEIDTSLHSELLLDIAETCLSRAIGAFQICLASQIPLIFSETILSFLSTCNFLIMKTLVSLIMVNFGKTTLLAIFCSIMCENWVIEYIHFLWIIHKMIKTWQKCLIRTGLGPNQIQAIGRFINCLGHWSSSGGCMLTFKIINIEYESKQIIWDSKHFRSQPTISKFKQIHVCSD